MGQNGKDAGQGMDITEVFDEVALGDKVDLQPTLGLQTYNNLDALLTSLLNLTDLSQVESQQKSQEASSCFSYRIRNEDRAELKRQLMQNVHAYVQVIQAWYSKQIGSVEEDFVEARKAASPHYAKCVAEQGFILFGRLERLFDMAVQQEAELNKAQLTKGILPGRSGVTADNLKACAQNLKGFWSQFSNNMLNDKRLNGHAFGPFDATNADDRRNFAQYCEQEKNWNSRLERFPINLFQKPDTPEVKQTTLSAPRHERPPAYNHDLGASAPKSSPDPFVSEKEKMKM